MAKKRSKHDPMYPPLRQEFKLWIEDKWDSVRWVFVPFLWLARVWLNRIVLPKEHWYVAASSAPLRRLTFRESPAFTSQYRPTVLVVVGRAGTTSSNSPDGEVELFTEKHS